MGMINGKKHNRALGMTLRAERATLSQVKERLRLKKEENRLKREKAMADKQNQQQLVVAQQPSN